MRRYLLVQPGIPALARLPEKGVQMGKRTKSVKRVIITLSFLFAAWLPLVGYVHFLGARPGGNLAAATWLTKQEMQRLAEFHGTDALKITQDRVFIRRGSRWIPVLKREPG